MTEHNDILGWRRALVYGLGLSGKAAAQLLLSRGVPVLGIDSRHQVALDLESLLGDPRFETRLGGEPTTLPEGIDCVILSPGVPPDRPLLKAASDAGIPVIAEVELAYRFLDGTVVGITGSNGKSTTTALTGELLAACGYQAEVCGNIGVPLAACVDGPAERVFVTELSSFQLEGIDEFRPHVAAWLNLSADHLDRHHDLSQYARAKKALFENQREGDIAVLNADDPEVAALVTRGRRRFFSRLQRVSDGCYLDGERVIEIDPEGTTVELFHCDELGIPGAHNLENAMAAALLARALGADVDCVRSGLTSFKGLPHRLQRVAEMNGVTWFDDSKGTNIGATLRTLEGFDDQSVHLILGGRNKGGDVRELLPLIGAKARHLYFIGEAGEDFHRLLGDVVPGSIEGTMDLAVESAARQAREGESVVLSPACASFDQYKNFRQRGRHFQTLVAQLGAEQSG
jgi:UDP-N-acetylmuramoylalanine--D-glutamate ligase